MNDKEMLLRELKRKVFIKRLETEDSTVAMTIALSLGLDIKYVKKHLVLDKNTVEGPYDLVTSITQNYIKIKTSKYNKIIRSIPVEDRFYRVFYNEKNQQYKIKIDIIKLFEYYYVEALEDEFKNSSVDFKVDIKNREQLMNISILCAALRLIPEDDHRCIEHINIGGHHKIRIYIDCIKRQLEFSL